MENRKTPKEINNWCIKQTTCFCRNIFKDFSRNPGRQKEFVMPNADGTFTNRNRAKNYRAVE